MTTAVLRNFNAYNKAHSKISSAVMPKINWKIIFIAGFLVCSFFLVLYVYQVIGLTVASDSIGNYENKIVGVSQENKELEVSFAENNFLGEVLQKARESGFQRTVSINYIQILNNSVAKAK